MSDLSPAAQAVLDAFNNRGLSSREWHDGKAASLKLAAALRTVADQICMKQPLGSTDADAGVFAAHHAISNSFLAIADELEAQ